MLSGRRLIQKCSEIGLVSRYGSDQFVCMTYGDWDLSLETMTEARQRKLQRMLLIPNLMIKYGVYEDVDTSLTNFRNL